MEGGGDGSALWLPRPAGRAKLGAAAGSPAWRAQPRHSAPLVGHAGAGLGTGAPATDGFLAERGFRSRRRSGLRDVVGQRLGVALWPPGPAGRLVVGSTRWSASGIDHLREHDFSAPTVTRVEVCLTIELEKAVGLVI